MQKPPHSYIIIGIISLLMAVVTYAGLIFKDDLNGRLIVGSVWLLMAVIWVFRYIYAKKRLARRYKKSADIS
ncbi:hypothetical protein KJ564_00190 [bacterium]|nr:hypothetical protein [bacterium]